jgi:hypothetical protein
MKRINGNMIWFVAIAVACAAMVHMITYESPEEKFFREATETFQKMNERTRESIIRVDSITERTKRFTQKIQELQDEPAKP